MHPSIDTMETLTPSQLAWRRALNDPSLRDLPYRIETNEYGQLVMSPVKRSHSMRAGTIMGLLHDLISEPGVLPVDLAIDTPKGVKVPDVVWMSEGRANQQLIDADAVSTAPEICVEVLSASNTRAEIDEKRSLYFACGAEEVWTCDVDGRMHFFDEAGEMPSSRRVPSFPEKVD
ncbi:MAG TPA: Uma2 family endonuclease [Rhodothermales bacterium]